MMKKILGMAALLGMAFTSSGASAVTFYLQPASGRPWTPSTVQATYNETAFDLQDTQVCYHNTGVSPVWVTDVQIDATNVTYSAVQDRARSGGNLGVNTFVKSRLVSFTAGGAVHQSTAWTDNSSLGSLTVPSNGTLFVQSQMATQFVDQGVSLFACLRSVRVTR